MLHFIIATGQSKQHGSISPTCLQAAFTQEDPKSTKRHQHLFALLGSLRTKLLSKTLVKLTPDVKFLCVK